MELTGSFEDLLTQLGQDLSQPEDWMTTLADAIVAQMKGDAPVDTGALRNSIAFGIQDTSIVFGMKLYGPFQNFGVSGTQDNRGVTVTAGVLPRPTNEPAYKFKTRKKGLNPQPFFNMQQIADQLAQGTINALNLE